MAAAPLGRRATLLGLATTAVTAMARPSLAAQGCAAGRDRSLTYAMRVSGVHVADVDLRLRCAGNFAMVEMDITNRGLAAWFGGRNRTAMNALVGFDGDDRPHAARFTASYQKPDRLRETELEFAPNGSLINLVTRNQGRPQESPVPVELRQPSIDPLATMLQIGDWLTTDPEPGEQVGFPVFEGRKRADLEVVYQGLTRLDIGGRSRDAHHLRGALQGLSGFDEDDNFVTLPGEPLDWIDGYASVEPTPIPLLIVNTASRLPTRLELVSG